jgi:flagellar motor protein MotB
MIYISGTKQRRYMKDEISKPQTTVKKKEEEEKKKKKKESKKKKKKEEEEEDKEEKEEEKKEEEEEEEEKKEEKKKEEEEKKKKKTKKTKTKKTKTKKKKKKKKKIVKFLSNAVVENKCKNITFGSRLALSLGRINTYSVEGDRRKYRLRMASSQQVFNSIFYLRLETDPVS